MRVDEKPYKELLDEIDLNLNELDLPPRMLRWYSGLKQEMEELRALVLDQLSDINLQLVQLDRYLENKWMTTANQVEVSGISSLLRHWYHQLYQAPRDAEVIKEDIKELKRFIEDHGIVKINP
jgi:hypothetical protein